MIGNAIERCAPSSPQKHITKESDGFHNYSTLLTGIEEVVRTDRTMNSEYINLKLVCAFL